MCPHAPLLNAAQALASEPVVLIEARYVRTEPCGIAIVRVRQGDISYQIGVNRTELREEVTTRTSLTTLTKFGG